MVCYNHASRLPHAPLTIPNLPVLLPPPTQVSSPEILDALLPHVFTNQLLLSDKVSRLNDQSVLLYLLCTTHFK